MRLSASRTFLEPAQGDKGRRKHALGVPAASPLTGLRWPRCTRSTAPLPTGPYRQAQRRSFPRLFSSVPLFTQHLSVTVPLWLALLEALEYSPQGEASIQTDTCHQDGYSATREPACKASGGRRSVMEGKVLHSRLHPLVPRLSLFLRSTDHALSAA